LGASIPGSTFLACHFATNRSSTLPVRIFDSIPASGLLRTALISLPQSRCSASVRFVWPLPQSPLRCERCESIGSRTDFSHCVPLRRFGTDGARDWLQLSNRSDHRDLQAPEPLVAWAPSSDIPIGPLCRSSLKPDLFKSSAKDLSFPIFEITIQGHTRDPSVAKFEPQRYVTGPKGLFLIA
jgi:hypothetical protein